MNRPVAPSPDTVCSVPSAVESGERRALRRSVALFCDVLAWDGGSRTRLRVTDLSPFGAWIETPQPLALGAALLLSIVPPGADPEHGALVLPARVVQAHQGDAPDGSGAVGMGVAFDASPSEWEILAAALHGLPPPLRASRLAAASPEPIDVSASIDDASDPRTLSMTPVASVANPVDDLDALREMETWFLSPGPATRVTAAPAVTARAAEAPLSAETPRFAEAPRFIRCKTIVRHPVAALRH